MSQFQPPNQWGNQRQQPDQWRPEPGTNPQYQPPQFYPYQEMPPQPPKKKSHKRLWLLLGGVILLLIVLGGISNAVNSHQGDSTTSTSVAPTSPPIQHATSVPKQPQWTTVQFFTGHLHNKTPFFTVAKGWRLSWSCTHASVPAGATGAFAATAYDHAGNTVSGNADTPTAASGHCPLQDSPTTGVGPVQQSSGSMSLEVYATGDWTIQVQVLK